MAVWQENCGMTDPIRLAVIAAIKQTRPRTDSHEAERIAFAAVCRVKAELRFLDDCEAVCPSL